MAQPTTEQLKNLHMTQVMNQLSGLHHGNSQSTIKPASAIASAEDTLRAARVLANRVEHIIERLCGDATLKMTGRVEGPEDACSPPVLVRLRRASEDADVAITRASAALDRLDVELN